MKNIKSIHFAEFLLNAIDVNYESVSYEDELVEVTVNDDISILIAISEDFRNVNHFQVYVNDVAVYKLKRISIGTLVRNGFNIRSLINKDNIPIDVSNTIKLTD